LFAMFNYLNDLLADGVPMFGLLPEPEPAFLTSALTAGWRAGFNLQSVAARTELDPVQILWESAQKPKPEKVNQEKFKHALQDFLSERGEPAKYFYIHLAGLIALAKNNALKQNEDEFDEALRKTQNLFETVLKDKKVFVHYSTSENIDTGLWNITRERGDLAPAESLSDQIEKAIVIYLQKNPNVIFLEVEEELNKQFTGLMTPSKGLIYAVLNSYAERIEGARWRLRDEDIASARREEVKKVFDSLAEIGKRLNYDSSLDDKVLTWNENKKPVKKFMVMASALLNKAIENADEQTVLVIPGGRAELLTYKQERDPSLKEKIKKYKLIKYRLIRNLLEVKVLTRETFEEQIASDPVEKSTKQMMMF
ncbi:MAG: hypothetical protein ACK40V_03140, partial [Anaerolineales bacterium]